MEKRNEEIEEIAISEVSIKKGKIIPLFIRDIGKKGDGIAVLDKSHYVVIVPNTKRGNTYDVEITRIFPNMAFGIVNEEKDDRNKEYKRRLKALDKKKQKSSVSAR